MAKGKEQMMSQCEQPWITQRVETPLRGRAVLDTPLLNKGIAFSEQEREDLHLRGLLPPGVVNLADQLKWAYSAYQRKSHPVDRHLFLRNLQDNNEVLFYRLVFEHIEEMAPIIYTPVIGAICQEYSYHFRRPRGLFVSYADRDRLDEVLAGWPQENVRVAVVTDGERVLGLGDQGIGGMGISIGKLALYTLCAGIHPSMTLPIFLDVGTDNPQLIADPLYHGWRHRRVRGAEYDAFIETFVAALFRRYPDILLQWEDFSKSNARRILERYQDSVCSFNDDIQGTAAVTLAGLLAAVSVSGTQLIEQRVVIVGAGSAGTGIGDLVVRAMIDDGLSEQEALDRVWIFNSKGLVNSAQADLEPAVRRFLKGPQILRKYGLEGQQPNLLHEVVTHVHPTALIGVSGQAGSFSESIVREMTRHVYHPIIFPLSNPTSHSEAVPTDLMVWTEGRALIATGSPFSPFVYAGKGHIITQCNNSLVFPGLGLAVLSGNCSRVVAEMLVAAGRALALLSPALDDPAGPLLPRLSASRTIARTIAQAIIVAAQEAGVAEPLDQDQVQERIASYMWMPEYPAIVPSCE